MSYEKKKSLLGASVIAPYGETGKIIGFQGHIARIDTGGKDPLLVDVHSLKDAFGKPLMW